MSVRRNRDLLTGAGGPPRILSTPVTALGCLTSSLAIFVVGGVLAGFGGLVTAAVLTVVVIALVGFNCRQERITSAGLGLARSVEDVLALKGGNSAARTELVGHRPGPVAGRKPVPRTAVDRVMDGFYAEGDEMNTFWDSLTAPERRALRAVAWEETFSAGAPLCREGRPADNVMVIRSGWTKVCVERSGRERIVAMRGPGDLVGERASLEVRSRSASVIALDTVQALLIATEDFAAFIRNHPRVLSVVEDQVYERLTEEPGGSLLRGAADLEHRLATLITELLPRRDDGRPVTLPLSERDLAGWAGASPLLVRRVLAAWRDKGLIGTSAGVLTVLDPRRLERVLDEAEQPGVPAHTSPCWTGQNCTVFMVDIAGFGALIRTDVDRRSVRAVMYKLLHDSFDSADVPWAACHREDRGDGALIVVPPGIPTAQVADRVIRGLVAGLAPHNHQASAALRIQLRVAIDVGPVVSDSEGVCGDAIIRAARLLDAPALKQRLGATSADLGLITSAFVYDAVIHDPAGFEQVKVEVKEAKLSAWVRLSGVGREVSGSAM
ncbi:cyclic nucleotide-binding domain-containing protein [Actinomadura scrupuli]|uniref:cyclic nucleotide-binding domain-containing protein n=1 Tax=Actinomadura scrupuli TaxID=559629 RepID=UPI003D999650